MSASTTSDNKRKSDRIANAPIAKVAKTEKKPTPRQQWLQDNEDWLDAVYQNIYDHMKEKYGENGVKKEGKRSFTNFCEVVCEEMCSGVPRILDDDSTDGEDEVDGLCSEDDEDPEEPIDDETPEGSQDIYDELDDDDDDEPVDE